VLIGTRFPRFVVEGGPNLPSWPRIGSQHRSTIRRRLETDHRERGDTLHTYVMLSRPLDWFTGVTMGGDAAHLSAPDG
jgi:hypothetical protein